MNVWTILPNVNNDGAHEPFWKKAIEDKKLAFMGWDDENEFGARFKNEIKKGDFILIAQGANWPKKLFIGGMVCNG